MNLASTTYENRKDMVNKIGKVILSVVAILAGKKEYIVKEKETITSTFDKIWRRNPICLPFQK